MCINYVYNLLTSELHEEGRKQLVDVICTETLKKAKEKIIGTKQQKQSNRNEAIETKQQK